MRVNVLMCECVDAFMFDFLYDNTMKKELQELTEGMQRLCAVANRVVGGETSRIEVDLLRDILRQLYDTTLRIGESTVGSGQLAAGGRKAEGGSEEEMAKMSTMAAMGSGQLAVESGKLAVDSGQLAVDSGQLAVESGQLAVGSEEPVVELPSVEDLENNGNALLFDEVVIEEKPAVDSGKPAVESEERPSLLDYLNQPAQRTLGESLATAPKVQSSLEKRVDDLRTVININDKFSFMSELFKGNMKAYNDFIMHLNAIEGREEALAHVSEMAARYKWDEASPTVRSFYKIFDKKF